MVFVDASGERVIRLGESRRDVSHKTDTKLLRHRLGGRNPVGNNLYRLAQLRIHVLDRVIERLGALVVETKLVDRGSARDLDARAPKLGRFVDARAQIFWRDTLAARRGHFDRGGRSRGLFVRSCCDGGRVRRRLRVLHATRTLGDFRNVDEFGEGAKGVLRLRLFLLLAHIART